MPTVYKLEEQLITCVGLAPAKPGVFMAAVKHVLVVCTNVEVVLLGVCFSGDNPSHQVRRCGLVEATATATRLCTLIALMHSVELECSRTRTECCSPSNGGLRAWGLADMPPQLAPSRPVATTWNVP